MKFFQLGNDELVISTTEGHMNDQSHFEIKELHPNTVDAAQEKHLPVIEVHDKQVMVNVGSISHPMTEEHLITTVYLETKKGGQFKQLLSTDAPIATFELTNDDEAVAAYAYCNLHGLWKTEA